MREEKVKKCLVLIDVEGYIKPVLATVSPEEKVALANNIYIMNVIPLEDIEKLDDLTVGEILFQYGEDDL